MGFELGASARLPLAPATLLWCRLVTLPSTGCALFLKCTPLAAGFHLTVKKPSKETTLNVLFADSLETFADMLLTRGQALKNGNGVWPARGQLGGERREARRGCRVSRKGALLTPILTVKSCSPGQAVGPVVAGMVRLTNPSRTGIFDSCLGLSLRALP